jgi:regulation of enolase protein 1 (concanavalin A-like superfamily)
VRWLNEPVEWAHVGGELSVDVEPETDFWRTTHYGFIRDSGHFAFETLEDEVALRFRGDFAAQYDQAGLMLRVDAEHWIKAGIELADGRAWLSVVVTNGVSDWSRQPAPQPDADGWWDIHAVREGDAVQLSSGGLPIRLAPLPEGVPVVAGPMCAAPQGPGFTARFRNIKGLSL